MNLLPIPEVNQGTTDNCGVYAALDICLSFGVTVSVAALYQRIHGFPWDGYQGFRNKDLTTVDQVLYGLKVTLGVGYDYAELWSYEETYAAVLAGKRVLVPVGMGALIPGQNYCHWIALKGIASNGDVAVSDSFREFDHGSDYYTLGMLEQAEKTGPIGPYGISVEKVGFTVPLQPTTQESEKQMRTIWMQNAVPSSSATYEWNLANVDTTLQPEGVKRSNWLIIKNVGNTPTSVLVWGLPKSNPILFKDILPGDDGARHTDLSAVWPEASGTLTVRCITASTPFETDMNGKIIVGMIHDLVEK